MGVRGNSRKREAMKRRLRMLDDGDVCWLCLRPLDFDIPSPDPLSVEIDEEIPVCLGGDPLDIRGCHLVHRACNLRKGKNVLQRGAYAPAGAADRKAPSTSRRW